MGNNNTLEIYYHGETRIVVSNYKGTILVRRNLTSLRPVFEYHNLFDFSTNTSNVKVHFMNSFRAEVETHMSLFNHIYGSIEDKLIDVFVTSKRHNHGLLDGAGTLFRISLPMTNNTFQTILLN